jgi:thioredoxin-related protein
MKTVLTIFLVTITLTGEWLTDFETAKGKAGQEKKYILLNFSGSDWCAPCIKMKKEVFEQDPFLAIANEQLILVRADFPRSKKNKLSAEQTLHNEALAEKYNPLGKFPYTLLLDANGKIIYKWDGYVFGSQDKFMASLKSALASK